MSIHYLKRKRGRYMRLSLIIGGDTPDPNAPYISPNLERVPVDHWFYVYLYVNGANQPAEWSSSDTSVAAIANFSGGYGQVRPLSAGNVKITATSDTDPSVIATLSIEVTETQPVAESVQITSMNLPLMVVNSISIDLESIDLTRRAVSININNNFTE